MKKYLFLMVAVLSVWHVRAQDSFSEANALYDGAKYKQAAELYRQTAAEYPASAEVWYNLGNAYYKSGKIGFSIAAYRRALKLDPGNEDIRYNLDFVFAKSSDKIAPAPKTFIVRQTDRVADVFTAGGWAFGATVWAVFGLGCFLLYIFIKSYRIKKWGLLASGFCWLLAFGFVALAAHRYYYALDSYAVIVAPSADILGEPTENGTRLLLLNEGATLKYKKHENGWIEVELPNGAQGFVPAEKMEVI